MIAMGPTAGLPKANSPRIRVCGQRSTFESTNIHLLAIPEVMEAVRGGYKEAKEAFVAGSNGGTVTRINCVCITALVWSLSPPHAYFSAQEIQM